MVTKPSLNLNWEKPASRTRLKQFLYKLGIKSAADPLTIKLQAIQDLVDQVRDNSGTPDRVVMSPSALEAFKKALGPKS